jgi:hypothetical protein
MSSYWNIPDNNKAVIPLDYLKPKVASSFLFILFFFPLVLKSEGQKKYLTHLSNNVEHV